jgi:hypothetical protein
VGEPDIGSITLAVTVEFASVPVASAGADGTSIARPIITVMIRDGRRTAHRIDGSQSG